MSQREKFGEHVALASLLRNVSGLFNRSESEVRFYVPSQRRGGGNYSK